MTETPSNRQPDPRSYPPYCDEEIKLIDYLRILWKWKWIIVVGTLICAAAAAVISLQMPKVFEISTNIVPPMAEFSPETQKITYIDTPDHIRDKIMSGMYNETIRRALALGPSEPGIAFTSVVGTGTGTVGIASRWREKNTDRGMEATRLLLQILSEEYAETIETMKNNHDRQMGIKREAVKAIREIVSLQNAIIADIEHRKKTLSKAMQEVERDNKNITGTMDSLLKRNSQDTVALQVLYAIMLNQNRMYDLQLDGRSYDLAMDKMKAELEQKKCAQKIEEINGEIQALNAKKEMISNIKIMKGPELSPRPVAPRVKQTTLLAGAVALCFFVFLAFFIEAIKMRFPRAGKRV